MPISQPFHQDVQLPENWSKHIKSALIHAISLAHMAITYSRGWAADSSLQRVRLAGELDAARNEIKLLNEEILIKDGRMARMPAKKRPFYAPTERLAILELRAARGWNLAETARTFMVEPETVASWLERLTVENDTLLQLTEPVNKYPEFVRYIVQKLKTLCPAMGKRRIAQVLARAGLHLGATTVGRMLKQDDIIPPTPNSKAVEEPKSARVVTARYPNHVWHVDMTTVPITGFWTHWFPFALPQVWPFCWWVAIILDHFSRTVIGFALFKKQPTSEEVRRFFATAIKRVGAAPKYLISDQGSQFTSDEFKAWCKAKPRNIRQRFGAVGQYGSIAVIERLMRSMKNECIAHILVPMQLQDIRRELSLYVIWYTHCRPHQALDGRVPMEVYFGIADQAPRWETRGSDSVPLRLIVTKLDHRRYLPIIELQQAA